MTTPLYGLDGIVVSPGVPLNRHPIAERAADANVSVLGDIELFSQARASLPQHKVVGIPRTNGKSPPTALIPPLLQPACAPTQLACQTLHPPRRPDPPPH